MRRIVSSALSPLAGVFSGTTLVGKFPAFVLDAGCGKALTQSHETRNLEQRIIRQLVPDQEGFAIEAFPKYSRLDLEEVRGQCTLRCPTGCRCRFQFSAVHETRFAQRAAKPVRDTTLVPVLVTSSMSRSSVLQESLSVICACGRLRRVEEAGVLKAPAR